MRDNLNFFGPYLKVERADKHIREVETLLERFVSDNKKRFLPKNQQRALKEGRAIQDVKPPKHFPTALGDAVHNLMASLDHAYCILIEANGHTTTYNTVFPFGREDWASLKKRIDTQIKNKNGPSAMVRDYVGAEVQSYPGGKHKLFELRQLDIADKHQCILPTSTDLYIKKAKLIDPTSGRTLQHIQETRFGSRGGSSIFVSGALLEVEHDLHSAFDVTFGHGQPLKGEPILPTLRMLRDNVTIVLNGLEAFL